MRLTGSPEFDEFWGLLDNETSRGLTIVVAAYFDERLGSLLGRRKGEFSTKINNAHSFGLLTKNEHSDLHKIREIRNAFAHNLRDREFDPTKSITIDSLFTWTIAAEALPYEEMFQTTRERLLYVAAVLAIRLNHRAVACYKVLPEPPFSDVSAWPPVVG